MPTNEERREVARKLRECKPIFDTHQEMVGVGGVLFALGLGYEDIDRLEFSRFDVERLADLIEPEPERTCHMTKIGGDRVLAGWWECSKCGPVYPPCKDEIAEWALRKCPHCGARVVDE